MIDIDKPHKYVSSTPAYEGGPCVYCLRLEHHRLHFDAASGRAEPPAEGERQPGDCTHCEGLDGAHTRRNCPGAEPPAPPRLSGQPEEGSRG